VVEVLYQSRHYAARSNLGPLWVKIGGDTVPSISLLHLHDLTAG
jgi:hypothetical protein